MTHDSITPDTFLRRWERQSQENRHSTLTDENWRVSSSFSYIIHVCLRVTFVGSPSRSGKRTKSLPVNRNPRGWNSRSLSRQTVLLLISHLYSNQDPQWTQVKKDYRKDHLVKFCFLNDILKTNQGKTLNLVELSFYYWLSSPILLLLCIETVLLLNKDKN